MSMLSIVIGFVVGALLGVVGSLVVVKIQANSILSRAQREYAQKLTDAEKESAALIRDAKARAREIELEMRQKMEEESKEAT